MESKGALGTPLAIFALGLRVILGVWFAISGFLKIFVIGLDEFTVSVANYRLVGEPWNAVIGYTIPWIELAGGIALVLGPFRRGAIVTIAGLVLVFAIGIGWAWSQGLDIACGCRGGSDPMNYWAKAAELGGYACVLAFLWWTEWLASRPSARASAVSSPA